MKTLQRITLALLCCVIWCSASAKLTVLRNAYPPFCTMVTVAFSHTGEATVAKDARAFLNIIKKEIQNHDIPLVVLGPVPFDVAMVSKTYRWRLSIKCRNNPAFRQFLNKAIEIYLKDKQNKSSVYVNINPLQE